MRLINTRTLKLHQFSSRILLDSGLLFSFAGSVLDSGREQRPL